MNSTCASIKKHLALVRTSRTVQLIRPKRKGPSRIIAPLIAQNQVIGYLYTDMGSLFGVFDETDRAMLGMLANQGAVALDNAGLLEGLERKVKERTEQLNARVDELALINSISLAMSQRLDIDGIIHIVGDMIREIFDAEVTEILMLDETTNLIHIPYSYYRVYQHVEPFPLGEGLTSRIIRTRAPITHRTLEEAMNLNTLFLSEEDKTESYIGVPILSGDKALGVVSVQSYQPYAFNDNHLRFLSTLASNIYPFGPKNTLLLNRRSV